MATYTVELIEERHIFVEVEAENEAEAVDTAKDAYTNNDNLQDAMLKDDAVFNDRVGWVKKDETSA